MGFFKKKNKGTGKDSKNAARGLNTDSKEGASDDERRGGPAVEFEEVVENKLFPLGRQVDDKNSGVELGYSDGEGKGKEPLEKEVKNQLPPKERQRPVRIHRMPSAGNHLRSGNIVGGYNETGSSSSGTIPSSPSSGGMAFSSPNKTGQSR